jgi:PAS domain S-box-containing protein
MQLRERKAPKFQDTDGGMDEYSDIHIFNIVYRTMIRLLEITDEYDIYRVIGRGLQELVGNSIVLVFTMNCESDLPCTCAVIGDDQCCAVLQRLAENEQQSIPLFFNKELKQELTSNRPVKISGGLFEITGTNVSRKHCVLIEKELDIVHTYAIGFPLGDRLSGGAVILLRDGFSDIDPYSIETFVQNISAAFQQRETCDEQLESECNYRDVLYSAKERQLANSAKRDALSANRLFQKGNENSSTAMIIPEYETWLESMLDKRNTELENINHKLLSELETRKKKEAELQRIIEEMDNLLTLAPVVIARADLKMNVQYVNRKFEEVTGYTAEEVVGKYWPSLGGFTVKDTRTMMKRAVQKLMGWPSRPLLVQLKRKDGQWIYVSGIGELVRENGRPAGFQVIGQDVTDRVRAEKEAKRSTTQLQKALEGIIQAMAVTVEMRDPYTAGHQRRVATRAREIAKEIGLPREQVVGIELAGLIHDLGKIRIPAEILTYPDVLSEPEFNIIKTHPAVGYDILKNIDFPWPVAGIVLQHHERMNGSGYPNGLKGEEIMLEARIIAVADVVEAIASHRPYRQALGIDRALKEIAENKGILYDPKVVDTCLALFTKKRFKFS